MTVEGTYGWLVLLGGLLAGSAGLCIFNIGRSRLLYDLHKIPGPAGWPLLGNALDVIGSKILHHHQVGDEVYVIGARLSYLGSSFAHQPCGKTLLPLQLPSYFLPRRHWRYHPPFLFRNCLISCPTHFMDCLL